MARNISISVSVQDQYSQSISSMRQKTIAFNKDVEELAAKIRDLNKEKLSLKLDAAKAQQTLKDLQQQLKNTGNAADQMILQIANANYSNACKQVERISKSAQAAKKDLSNMVIEISKADNRAGLFGGFTTSTNKSISGNIIQGGTHGLVNITSSQKNRTDYTSMSSSIGMAIGGAIGNAAKAAGTAAATGAAAGSALPVVGTVLGAIGGIIIGSLINGINSAKSDDDTKKELKDYSIDRYNDILKERHENLTTGSASAASFETNSKRMQFYLGKSTADNYLRNIKSALPYTKEEQMNLYAALDQSGYNEQETIDAAKKIRSIGVGASLTANELTTIATTLGDMKNANQATIEWMDSFKNSDIDVYQELANRKNISVDKAYSMVESGQVSGSEASDVALNAMYNKTAGQGLSTYEQKAQTWENMQNDLNEAEGRGYNKEREKGLDKNIEWFEKNRQELITLKEEVGRGQAELDNKRDQIMIDQLDAVINKNFNVNEDKTKTLKEIPDLEKRLEYGNDFSMAEVKGEEKFAQSEEGLAAFKANTDLAKEVVENSIVTFSQDIMTMENLFAESVSERINRAKDYATSILAAAINGDANFNNIGTIVKSFESGDLDPNTKQSQDMLDKFIKKNENNGLIKERPEYRYKYEAAKKYYKGGKAFGMERVPYDNFPALLHQDEQVLTAQQVRQQKNIPSVTVTGNNFVIREEADITKVAKAFVAEMQKAYAIT